MERLHRFAHELGEQHRLLHLLPDDAVLVIRQRDGGENADDRDHDHQFDQSESVCFAAHALLLHIIPASLKMGRYRATTTVPMTAMMRAWISFANAPYGNSGACDAVRQRARNDNDLVAGSIRVAVARRSRSNAVESARQANSSRPAPTWTSTRSHARVSVLRGCHVHAASSARRAPAASSPQYPNQPDRRT